MPSRTTIIIYLLLSLHISAQEIRLKGTIKDAKSGESIQFARISIVDQNKGTLSNESGFFELDCNKENLTLFVSCIGYKTENVFVNADRLENEIELYLYQTSVLLQEVIVYSNKISSINRSTLQNKQIQQVSTVYPDIFRSIQSLPGIAVNNEFSAKFNVRGGNYDENLVLVNNTQVYEPFHVKEAGNASIGIFNTDMMKNVTLIAGGFSAKYGDRLSSVLDIEYRDGNKEKYAGFVSFSLTNFDGLIEGPLGTFGSFILGARKSYVDYAMDLLKMDENIKISFYDVQGVFTFFPFNKVKTQIKIIHAGDDFKFHPEIEITGPRFFNNTINKEKVTMAQLSKEFDDERAKYFSNLIDLQTDYTISDKAVFNLSLSYYDQEDAEYSDGYNDYSYLSDNQKYYLYSFWKKHYENNLNIKTVEGKAQLDLRISPYYDFVAGVNFINISYDQFLVSTRNRIVTENIKQYPKITETTYDESETPIPQVINTSTHKLNGFAENILQITNQFILNAGIRFDYFGINKELTFSPRASLSYNFFNNILVRAAWGYYYQSPIYRQLYSPVASDTNTKSLRAEHYVLGIEKPISLENESSLNLKAELYYKRYTNLISSKIDSRGVVIYSRKNDSYGYATGIDISCSLLAGRYNGWVNYGLLFAKENLLNDNSDYFPRYTDQRHTISFINNFYLGLEWNVNINFNYGSGFAYTPKVSVYNTQEKKYQWKEKEINSSYLPEYKRVDLKISKQFSLWNLKSTFFLEVSNLFDFNNLYGYRYRFNSNGFPFAEEMKLWPIIPSIGFRTEF